MTEIVVDITSIGILHVEILISLGHRMNLGDMGNHMEPFCHFSGLIYQVAPVIIYLWPFRSNAMQIPSLRKELTTHCIGRDDDFSLSIML